MRLVNNHRNGKLRVRKLSWQVQINRHRLEPESRRLECVGVGTSVVLRDTTLFVGILVGARLGPAPWKTLLSSAY